jgi:beta-lactamase class A
MNNTTTARDLGMLLTALAQFRAASPAACREMLEVLGRQHFTEGIPAGLPAGTRVEHKTGWIGGVVYHDAAIVRPAGRAPYVLVVLTGGVKDDSVAYALVRDISHQVYAAVRAR